MLPTKRLRKPSVHVRSIATLMCFLVVAALVIPVAGPLAQGPTDEEIASQLEVVVLEETVSPGAVNTRKEIPAFQDTYVASNRPGRNYGQASELRIGYNLGGSNDGALRSFVQFDVAGNIPARAVIDSATLQLYQFAVSPGNDSSMNMVGRHLNSPWNENVVTWNSHEPNWGDVSDSSWVGSSLGWKSFDVTTLVRDWLSRTSPNNGVINLGDEHVQERQRFFYSLNANNGRYPRLVVDYHIGGDITPPVATVYPLPPWSKANFTVSWHGYDPGGSGIAYFDVQYRTEHHDWMDWQMHATYPSAEFVGAQDGVEYKFRCRAVDKSGNVQAWGDHQAQTQVDATPPQVTVDPLPEFTLSQAFNVSWSGSDNLGGSGIANYDVQYQIDNGPWLKWLVGIKATSALFTGAHDDGVYGFRARGTDVAGNIQPYSARAQATTRVETSGPHSSVERFNPPITQDDSFAVAWTGSAGPGLSIEYFDVRYQFNEGPWIDWLAATKTTGATFTKLNPKDGVYGFEVRAKDSAGRLEPFNGVAEALMTVDRFPPFVEPRLHMPLVASARHR
jgi:hypothetical protein